MIVQGDMYASNHATLPTAIDMCSQLITKFTQYLDAKHASLKLLAFNGAK